MTHRGPFQPLPFCDSVLVAIRQPLPIQAGWILTPPRVINLSP